MAEPNATSSNIATSSATGSRNGVQIDTNFHGGDGNQQADPTITATSTIVTATNNAATTTTSADDQQWNTHPVYKALSTAAAQRAFLAHATRCAELGSKDKGGIMLPTLSTAVDGNGKLLVLTADPELLYMPCMEEKYGKPKVIEPELWKSSINDGEFYQTWLKSKNRKEYMEEKVYKF